MDESTTAQDSMAVDIKSQKFTDRMEGENENLREEKLSREDLEVQEEEQKKKKKELNQAGAVQAVIDFTIRNPDRLWEIVRAKKEETERETVEK